MNRDTIGILFSTLFTVIAIGTIYFRYVEGWSWLDAYFFTVVTISTVGYGNVVPVTAAGKIGTTVLIFVGLGIFAAAIQQLSHFTVHRRSEMRRQRRDQRKDQDGSE
ncbi:Ion channel [Cognatiyoonia koreensis]|uniref:Ion channel n=1 Tax=Cognatiyoonia koreensis TaxID=364200 RepID=A0A1I0P713_9RHOB|nr:potassium channel family protein [Cognatiyoonia koreensis]SEW10189.1 Ion channel [Cognatiyoonia koreensis]